MSEWEVFVQIILMHHPTFLQLIELLDTENLNLKRLEKVKFGRKQDLTQFKKIKNILFLSVLKIYIYHSWAEELGYKWYNASAPVGAMQHGALCFLGAIYSVCLLSASLATANLVVTKSVSIFPTLSSDSLSSWSGHLTFSSEHI